ncbi:allophanate hydrolase [Rhodoblastus acidophilus]|uniref:Allophanate hydrolase n=1 Tax=Candidatus Rhodoblastus alkanivorans TaxID=2954117 RepID=A0ABS9ZCG0_9HYPH|nr:allophanate hydrolase [Candidatus Rhodoblastus alkanivorans]MCI4677870.1 allophanate hydrolase [Candidatus Rhodoblastus alkanivorans]MCI4684631.1 allophanate hydrolase [Candidatus Rhodoblastus alkanivorans]MDI4641953.1 allophanate hydrolase [Rhodoblastus acidophilus]
MALFTLDALRARYAARPQSVLDVVEEVLARIEACDDPAIFISRVAPDDFRAGARDLLARAPDPASLPLWGVPYAVKDNIDVEGMATTAACPDFAYVAAKDATVVARLRAAGALLVGKTNLDQFATGLNGTRSPYGAPRCVFNADYVSGGSSSGSAVAVARGLVAFSLGTDTAGSGRVPAAFNNIVGVKPTPGLVSAAGVVPACRSLDCVNVFATNVADGVAVRRAIEGFDPEDSYTISAPARGLPPQPRVGFLAAKDREFYGDAQNETLYGQAMAQAEKLGWRLVEFDYAPFAAIAALLYEGPWLAERLAAVDSFLAQKPEAFDPTVRGLIESAKKFSAADAFRGQYRLKDLLRAADREAEKFDFMLLPTSPTIHTVAAMKADPVRLNAQFGRYTNFVNFRAMAAIAIPAGFRADGLPFGVTLIGPAQSDEALAPFAAAFHAAAGCGAGASREAVAAPAPTPVGDHIEIVVVGAHLAGEPLNWQLTQGGGWLVEATRTAPDYRLFALANTAPPKPGLIHEPGFVGPGLEVEVWSLPADSFGRFVNAIPAPLGVGKVTLASGRQVTGFLCESHALAGAREITAFGGWRAFLSAS